jgi:hypothetical protein
MRPAQTIAPSSCRECIRRLPIASGSARETVSRLFSELSAITCYARKRGQLAIITVRNWNGSFSSAGAQSSRLKDMEIS